MKKHLMNMGEYVWRRTRSLVIIVLGVTVILIGVALLVLPGPAVVVIPAGLAILGTELVWARRLFKRLKNASLDLAYSAGLANARPRDDDDGSADESKMSDAVGAGAPSADQHRNTGRP